MAAPSQPDRPRLRKLDRTRLRLVEATRQLLQASGGFTAERVAREAGASPATFYNHFPSKSDALAAVFQVAMDDLVEVVGARLQIEHLLERGLEGFAADWVHACCDFLRANSQVFSAARVQFPGSPALREVYRSREAAALDRFRRFVQLGQAARAIREGDANAIAEAMMVTAEGWNNPAVLRLDEASPLHQELSRMVVRMLAPEDPR